MSYLAQLGVPHRYCGIAATEPNLSLPDLAGGRWVFLFGPAGCGKTHRAVEILHAHLSRVGRPRPSTWRPWHNAPRPAAGPRFVDWPLYLDAQRKSFGVSVEPNVDPAWLVLENTAAVILDDLGSERPTDFAVDALNVVVSSRYNACAPTIITSNLPLDGIASAYGDRIASRIREAALVADQGGADWRSAIAKGESC